MTHAPIPPEDAFDQWLDDLADGSQSSQANERGETAAELHRLLGVAPVTGPRLSRQRKAAIRQRVLPRRTSSPTPLRSGGATGIVASPGGVIPLDRHWTPGRIVNLVSAAILALFALASAGLVLRLDDGDRMSGVSSTASIMSFAPASALASPTPVADCATDGTLLLMPESEPDAAALADLPFPVAWYWDGVLTVEQSGEVIREIEIGPAQYLRPTPWPDVAVAYTPRTDAETQFTTATLVNLATGAVFELGRLHAPQWTGGPFMFWASDEARLDWHMLDLRTFERISLAERFNFTPVTNHIVAVGMGNASDDGTVLLVTTTTVQYSEPTTPRPTFETELPELQPGALLVNGSLDDMRVVGPLADTSGAMTLSPDGELMAWLAPFERAGLRTLTIADTATGEVIHTQQVEAIYSNSLLINRDGSVLYSASRTTLDRIAILQPDEGTPTVVTAEPIPLPDTAYRIVAAAPDRDHLLLARSGSDISEDSLLWLDVTTGETREFEGRFGRIHESYHLNDASQINTHVSIFQPPSSPHQSVPTQLLDMETGETVGSIDNSNEILGTGVAMISTDGSTAFNAPQEGVQFLDLGSGQVQEWPAPVVATGNATSFAITADGSCAVVTWPTDDDGSITRHYSADAGELSELPSSPAEGWVPAGDAG